jgi:hypothetical protein
MGRCGGLVEVMLKLLVVVQGFVLVSTTDQAENLVDRLTIKVKLQCSLLMVGR